MLNAYFFLLTVEKKRRIYVSTLLLRAASIELRAIAHSSWLTANSLLFLDESLNNFTVFCNNLHEVNSAVQVCYVNT